MVAASQVTAFPGAYWTPPPKPRKSFHPPSSPLQPPPLLEGMKGGVPHPPDAPLGMQPLPLLCPKTGATPTPSSPPSLLSVPPPEAPPPDSETRVPVNNCISIAATREVTTSLMAVSRAVFSELPIADQMDCDFVSSASNTPSACRLKESKIRWLWSRTNCAWRIAAFPLAP